MKPESFKFKVDCQRLLRISSNETRNGLALCLPFICTNLPFMCFHICPDKNENVPSFIQYVWKVNVTWNHSLKLAIWIQVKGTKILEWKELQGLIGISLAKARPPKKELLTFARRWPMSFVVTSVVHLNEKLNSSPF